MSKVIKRNGTIEEFDQNKIINAISKAFISCDHSVNNSIINTILDTIKIKDKMSVEDIQNAVEVALMALSYYDVAKAYILYRNDHAHARFIKDRIDYINKYSNPEVNASSASETDANANVSQKNVAALEGEVFKTTNRIIQRQRMKDKLNEMFPEVADEYEKDLNNHIIYVHDEASSPVLKYYCQAVSLYPLMAYGVGNIDGVTPSAPNDLQSFSGQVTNLTFLLSAQCKGAVAEGEYQIALCYYIRKEFGDNWYNKLDCIVSNEHCIKQKTIKSEIRKAIKQFIYGISQPAGNRSYNSPFTNISIYDHVYFDSLFSDFRYPDGTSAKWEEVDCVQRIILELRRELNLLHPMTFPVTTIALVNDGKDCIDQEYKELCASEWAKGSSHFCYNSNNPTSLASCCRVLNEMTENTFSSINGLQGIMTGSCNVITLNLNRIIQNWAKEVLNNSEDASILWKEKDSSKFFQEYLTNILSRVYKYHIAFKTMLYETEEKGMFASSNGGYIYMKKLYSTIGLLGYQEAAMFLGLKIGDNEEYLQFLQTILSTIKEQNKIHSIRDKKRPFLFNSEAVPGENLAVKLYQWDKSDGYYVPSDRNLYASYFFNPWDDNTNVLEKMRLHGNITSQYADGGQACHINLDSHLSKEQYLKLIDYSTINGTSYFTFNIPLSKCQSCGHVVNAPIEECPICKSNKIEYFTRIIGYLTSVNNWSKERYQEFFKRVFHKNSNIV